PDSVPGVPSVDILQLDPTTVPATYRPNEVRVYRYRASRGNSGINPNLGGITATARRSDSDRRLTVQWEVLIQGRDYYLDPSGLWFVLANKLDQNNDHLAVSFRTASGGTVGTFPEADAGPGSTDSLELIVLPLQTPAEPTFRHEMRNIYRVAGADLSSPTLEVGINLNRSERPLSGNAETYLQQLGLALPSDPTLFDRENRLFPRVRDDGATTVVKDAYIVFPHLTPFADPTRLTPAETSDSLYRTPLNLLLSEGPPAKFNLELRYDAVGGGDRSTLDLNALQVREGSEKLYVNGRRLEKDVDYTISYDVGQVTFLNPDLLFGQGTAQVTARFEERGLFAVAPTTILGMSTRYSLGERGAVNLIGMYQREQSAFNRPALGFEATANLIGGVNTELHFKPSFLNKVLGGLVSSPATAPSLLDVNAEFAFTKPDPNRSGEAYLEEFESEAGIQVSLRETQWEYGSAPQDPAGVEDIFPGGFAREDAVAFTWQNLREDAPGSGTPVELRPQDIDPLIRIAGRGEEPEVVMYTTTHPDTAGRIGQFNANSRWIQPRRDFAPRWRSIVTPLSSTGVDLTRDEFLEFWLFQDLEQTATTAGLRLILDLGSVNEDALAIAPDTFVTQGGADTLFTGRQYVGVGRLDTERGETGIFNADVDDLGILGDRPDEMFEIGQGPLGEFPLCQRELGSRVPVFPWGDLGARCTRGNGVLDTEDLDGDLLLNQGAGIVNENVFRYIVDLTDDRYFVREGARTRPDQDPEGLGRTTAWRLYRIPIRTPDRVINTPTLRLIQHMRMTFVTPPDNGSPDLRANLAVARMRFIGSPWTRRAETPIFGLNGAV
ncbi:MAG TPA: cell surface protein SprA, partial [Gemmatimonadales bacterium]|nr:cell surface protein SprA [Gemmatimonadales bacterium]